jgi:hypothetical protein
MDALWPDLPEQRSLFEIVLIVPREDKGEPLVPRALPPEVLGCWSADRVIVSATVLASDPARAVAAVEALVPELTRAAGAAVTVRVADARGRAPVVSEGDAATGSTRVIGGRLPVGLRGGCPQMIVRETPRSRTSRPAPDADQLSFPTAPAQAPYPAHLAARPVSWFSGGRNHPHTSRRQPLQPRRA